MCSPVQRSCVVALFSELRRSIFSGELIFIRTFFTNGIFSACSELLLFAKSAEKRCQRQVGGGQSHRLSAYPH